MDHTIPSKCPSCGEDMRVCLLRCSSCATEVQGDFSLGRFARLSDGQLHFLETFIMCRGSLKDVGAALGISYPTARNRLDGLVEGMGLNAAASKREARLAVLTQLSQGDITAEEALNLLQGGKGYE